VVVRRPELATTVANLDIFAKIVCLLEEEQPIRVKSRRERAKAEVKE